MKPQVFVGSSQLGRTVAEQLCLGLSDEVEAKLWSDGLFELSLTAIETLDNASRTYDFAVLLLTPDDIIKSKGRQSVIPRDNVVFEVGLFMGALGRHRTVLVVEDEKSLHLPTDLLGLTTARYTWSNGIPSLNPACSKIKHQIRHYVGRPAETWRHKQPRLERRRSFGSAQLRGQDDTYPIVNISVTGALLETKGLIKVGQKLHIVMTLEPGKFVRTLAEVVRIQYRRWGQVGAVGVKFSEFEEGAHEILTDYVNDRIGSKVFT